MTARYLEADLKVLWGEAAARCAFPGCRIGLVRESTARDPKKALGEIAHIVAARERGPRADPSMPADERRREPNLILLCPNHHRLVDGQPNAHTADDLRRWKDEHREWVDNRLTEAVADLGFAELQRLTDALVAQVAPAVASVTPPIPPAQKLRKNDLTLAVSTKLQIGSLRFPEVQEFVARATQSDDGYGERLRAGFRERYELLVDSGSSGDRLFEEIVDWASGASTDFDVMAAAIAVVTYLFTACELFES